MKRTIITAVLALVLSSAFAGGNGWDKKGHDNRYKPAPAKVVVYRAPVPQRANVYVQKQPVRYAMPVENCAPVAMSPYNFSLLQQTMNRSGFEGTRMGIFKQALCSNYFTSQQVLELMNQFCFDDYRLDVAKMAYSKTVDPYNYYVVNNAFSFSSSVNELGDYLAMR